MFGIHPCVLTSVVTYLYTVSLSHSVFGPAVSCVMAVYIVDTLGQLDPGPLNVSILLCMYISEGYVILSLTQLINFLNY
jgi:hypothetical protein